MADDDTFEIRNGDRRAAVNWLTDVLGTAAEPDSDHPRLHKIELARMVGKRPTLERTYAGEEELGLAPAAFFDAVFSADRLTEAVGYRLMAYIDQGSAREDGSTGYYRPSKTIRIVLVAAKRRDGSGPVNRALGSVLEKHIGVQHVETIAARREAIEAQRSMLSEVKETYETRFAFREASLDTMIDLNVDNAKLTFENAVLERMLEEDRSFWSTEAGQQLQLATIGTLIPELPRLVQLLLVGLGRVLSPGAPRPVADQATLAARLAALEEQLARQGAAAARTHALLEQLLAAQEPK